MTTKTIFEIVFFIMILLAITWFMSHGDKARRKRFLGRVELSPDEFYQQYYESSELPKEQVIEILNNIARALAIPAVVLRPTDRFTEELASEPGWEYDDGLGLLEWEVYSLLRKKGSKLQSDIKNIDDYIRCIIALGKVEPKCCTKGLIIAGSSVLRKPNKLFK
ncbi:hypothetical protein [Candidatus Magnetominusculus xianensis]|uniref:Uncharacterized protein n=1 Tax=Candidatus Magnetominusculus xianensis TaxID=1748249 RepID=A0ABR5SD82_9BACT|nr:hypothetical protein [Candidatus Magnetominusculus xianensis]KWT82910.1 hypothetical protein ASN18_2350 [Candidatus Magnetominusculus xianensis]MBF0405312.1 hypothetical protein [Nitrospirota bacterium]